MATYDYDPDNFSREKAKPLSPDDASISIVDHHEHARMDDDGAPSLELVDRFEQVQGD